MIDRHGLRKGAARDAARARLMRRAIALLTELDEIIAAWDLEGRGVAISGLQYELDQAAREDEAAALECFDDTPLPTRRFDGRRER
jgi:hypothetical protein